MNDLDPEELADLEARLAEEARTPQKVVSRRSDLGEELRFRHPLRVMVVLAAVVTAVGTVIQQEPWVAVIGGGVVVVLLAYVVGPARRITLGPGRRVAVEGHPLEGYSWRRAYQSPGPLKVPTKVVLYRRDGAHPLAGLRATWRPSANRRRAVVLCNGWRTADGRLVAPGTIASLVD